MDKLKCLKMMIGAALLIVNAPVLTEAATARETPIVKVVQENAEAVVNIATEHIILLRNNPSWGHYGGEFDFIFDQFFGFQRPRRALKLNSVGSGVIIDRSGIIVTNAHVVHMASNIFVVLNDGTSAAGKIVYENPGNDLAIVRINPPKPLKEVKLGTTEDIMIGESVVAIGNPLGLENSVTSGVISGVNRDIFSRNGTNVMGGLLQIDAPINPGNSGGALLNLDGELIGINVAVVQNSQNIGFAIPVEKVKNALKTHEDNSAFSLKHQQKKEDLGYVPFEESARPLSSGDEWDPFTEMTRMAEEMDRLFQGAFGKRGSGFGGGMFNTDISYDANFDIEEEQDQYLVKINVSGIDKNKIDIQINEGSMTVSGERSVIEEEKGTGRYYQSQSVGSFLRTIPLPEDADTENVKTEIIGDEIVVIFPKIK